MDLQPLPFRSPISAYQRQADVLLAAQRAADPLVVDVLHRNHPRFLDNKITWRPKLIAAAAIRQAGVSLDDARVAIARYYDFLDWPSLAAYVAAVSRGGAVLAFEPAYIINGNLGALREALRKRLGNRRSFAT
jgi:hypothetical protein